MPVDASISSASRPSAVRRAAAGHPVRAGVLVGVLAAVLLGGPWTFRNLEAEVVPATGTVTHVATRTGGRYQCGQVTCISHVYVTDVRLPGGPVATVDLDRKPTVGEHREVYRRSDGHYSGYSPHSPHDLGLVALLALLLGGVTGVVSWFLLRRYGPPTVSRHRR